MIVFKPGTFQVATCGCPDLVRLSVINEDGSPSVVFEMSCREAAALAEELSDAVDAVYPVHGDAVGQH